MDRTVIAVIGLGNWGRNHVRTFVNLPQCRVKYVADRIDAAAAAQIAQYPAAHLATASPEVIYADPEVRAVVIATPVATHFELTRAALEAGKDVLVEKPLAQSVAQAEELIELAAARGCILEVGHQMLFHPAIQFLKELIARGELGDIHYVYSQRLNLGVVRSSENALWSLAPHDISILNYLLGGEPGAVQAGGGCYLQPGIEDVIFVTLTYPGGKIAHIHVSWLDPHKIRRLTIVGSKKMAVFDDMEVTEKVRIYDKGVSRPQYESYGEALAIRMGDIFIPNIPNTEPLRLQAQHFLACVRERTSPRADGHGGLAVVRALELASARLSVGAAANGAQSNGSAFGGAA